MKKFLIFISGFVAGIAATILVLFLIGVANKSNDVLGLTVFPKAGECIATEGQIEIFQVLEPNVALARIGDIFDGIVVLLVNYDGQTYYDNQKIEISANKCARQIGTYQYTTKDKSIKTVPAVVIDINTNGSKNEVQVQKQYVEVKGKKGNATLYIGMSKDSVQVLVGKPDEVDLNSIGNSTNEKWGYKINNKYISDLDIDFENGKLKSVRQN